MKTNEPIATEIPPGAPQAKQNYRLKRSVPLPEAVEWCPLDHFDKKAKPLTEEEKATLAKHGLSLEKDYNGSVPDARQGARELVPETMERARKLLEEKPTAAFTAAVKKMDEEEAKADAAADAAEAKALAAEYSAETRGIFSLKRHAKDDPTTLIGDRWLCRGGGALLVAPTGVGEERAHHSASALFCTRTNHAWIYTTRTAQGSNYPGGER